MKTESGLHQIIVHDANRDDTTSSLLEKQESCVLPLWRRGKKLCTLGGMTRAQFERLVREALSQIPDEIRDRLDNVDLVVEDMPNREQLAGSGIEETDCLLGLYEGIPLTERYGYNMVLPDKITLFQQSIESICASDDEIIEEIQSTVVHEVAHHFGIDDESLEEMGV